MATINDIIEQIRFHLVDYSVVQSNVTDEKPVASKPQSLPHAAYNFWNSSSTGKNYEEFLTAKVPMVSGSKVLLKGGRWKYDYVGEYPGTGADTAYSSTGRKFLIDYYRGIFVIPSGCIPIASGDKVLLTYSFWEDQEYRFNDIEIKSWMLDGDSYLRRRISLPWVISGRGSSLYLDPMPSGLWMSVLALSTSYLMRARLQEEAVQDGIYVKTGSTVLDTTKTLAHRGKSLEQVRKDLEFVIDSINTVDIISAGIRIDTYSTLDHSYGAGIGAYQEYGRVGFPFMNDGY